MTLLRRALGGGELRVSLESPTLPLTSTALADMLSGPHSSAGPAVTPQGSLAMPAVWRAVNIISGAVAALPLKLYEDGTKNEFQSDLLRKPCKAMTRFEFWEFALVHILLWGNFFALKIRDSLSQEITELRPILPGSIKVGAIAPDDNFPDGRIFHVRVIGGGEKVLSSREVFHIPGFGYDGVCGVSPISLARNGIGLALAAEEASGNLFASGNMMTGVLSVEQKLTPKQADDLATRWRAKRAATAGANEIAVLGMGSKFQPISMPNRDAQFMESRAFQVTEIARWFGLPSFMLNDSDKSTSWGSGLEQMGIGFVVYTLQSFLVRMEQRVEDIDAPSFAGKYAKFKVDGLLRGDSAARGAFYKTMREIGAFSVNDILRLEDMPTVGEEGDTRLQPLNMAPLGLKEPQAPAPATGTDTNGGTAA